MTPAVAFFHDQMQGAVEKRLAARGFVPAESGTPDLLLHYHANIMRRIEVNVMDRQRGYCYDEGCRVMVIDAEAGTIVLDMVNARSRGLVWRGWAQTEADALRHDRDGLARRLDEAVARMLERLPIGGMMMALADAPDYGAGPARTFEWGLAGGMATGDPRLDN